MQGAATRIYQRKFFDIADQPGLRAWLICFFTKGAGKENSICLRRLSAGAAVWKEEADIKLVAKQKPPAAIRSRGLLLLYEKRFIMSSRKWLIRT